MDAQFKAQMDEQVRQHAVLVFMKGTKDAPQCGFSNQVVQIFKTLNVPFETVNILADETVRQGMKEYSDWPTFPQVYVNGEFVGGCDIVTEMFQKGELQALVQAGHGSH